MHLAAPALIAVFLASTPALASTPLDLGTPPTLDWGEHRLSLQVGWPVQAIGLSWGTRSGWAGGAFTALDPRAPDPLVAVGMSATRPLGHGQRTSAFFHLAGALDLRHHRPSGPMRIGGEGEAGVLLGVGLGKHRRATWDLGAVPSIRLGPGLASLGPHLGLHGRMGLTFHLAPEVALSARGRVGLVVQHRGDPALDWAAGLVMSRLF